MTPFTSGQPSKSLAARHPLGFNPVRNGDGLLGWRVKRNVLTVCLIAGLGACQPTADAPPASPSPAPSTPPAPSGPPEPAASAGWEVALEPVLTLSTGGDALVITCEEGKKELLFTFQPAWEKEGPFDRAAVHFGDTSFPVLIDASAQKTDQDRYRPTYVLQADADTVTALMMAANARLVVTNQDGEQERTGDPDDSGAFDMFGTTCAQINGLR